MGHWNASSSDLDHGKETVEPAEKKCKSLKLNWKELDRWDFISEERENNLSRKYVPNNTAATTKFKWVLSNFKVWKQGRNKCFAGDSGKFVPDDILHVRRLPILRSLYMLTFTLLY